MLSLDPQDTIAAISSPTGPALRGIVRLSGTRAWEIARSGFQEKNSEQPAPKRPEWRPGRFQIDGLRPTLPATVAFWPGQRTYTGEPMAEIHTTGSPPLLQCLLSDRLTQGARLAQPGEFTLRAFLNGRIDLTRAEAVLGVIDAHNPSQLEAALRQLAGGLSGPITQLRDRLLDILAHLEAGLDFSDDEPDVDLIGRERLAESLAQAAEEVADLADRLRARDRSDARPRVVLVGPPNAGKSQLFNALLGRSEALVSNQAGTTRDYLAAPCDCDGLVVELVDTAGIESASDAISERAQAFRDDQAGLADLLLDCRSGDLPELVGEFSTSPERPRLSVWTKADLFPAAPEGSIVTSSAEGSGLATLKTAIAEALRRVDSEGDAPTSTAARCGQSLRDTADSLRQAADTLALGGGDELVALDLREGLDELGQVIGEVVTDDILDRIFARFCIGK